MAPDPVPQAGEVLVDVHAASINFPDLLVIGGTLSEASAAAFQPRQGSRGRRGARSAKA